MKFYITDYLIERKQVELRENYRSILVNRYSIQFWYLDEDGDKKKIEFFVKYWMKMVFLRWRLKKAIAKNGYFDINLF